MPYHEYHPDFRQNQVRAIVSAVDSGNCVSVVGAPSVGKTNLLRFLSQDENQPEERNSPWLRYADLNRRHERGRLVAIHIDPNLLLPPLNADGDDIAARSWPGFELLAHRVRRRGDLYPRLATEPHHAAPRPDAALEKLARRVERYQKLFVNAHDLLVDDEPLVGHLALRHFENLLEAVLEGHRLANTPVRLVFLIDEFEQLLAALPDYFFIALRGLRDRFKYRLMYVVFTRNRLWRVAGARAQALEPFIELFGDREVWLGPYGDEDAWRMIERLEKRTLRRDDHALGLIIRATGGFAGLLRASFQHTDALGDVPADDFAAAARVLYPKGNVRAECETLLRALTDREIAALYAVADGQDGLEGALADELARKSLLRTQEGRLRVWPLLLEEYIRNNPQRPTGRVMPRPATLPEQP